MEEKIFYIFAGVNGAGKTTLYNIFCEKYGRNKFGKRINTDEIVTEIGSWKNGKDQVRAARMAIEMRKDYIEKGIVFNQETTLTGKSILNAIKEIKKNGYKIIMNYVGVESPEIAKERVKIRVKKGGHDIPEKVIEKRYYESLKNLKEIWVLCDELIVYDNSKFGENHAIYIKKENDEINIYNESKIPNWINDFKNYIEN